MGKRTNVPVLIFAVQTVRRDWEESAAREGEDEGEVFLCSWLADEILS